MNIICMTNEIISASIRKCIYFVWYLLPCACLNSTKVGGRILILGGQKIFFEARLFPPDNPWIFCRWGFFPPKILEFFPRRGFFTHKTSDLSQNFEAGHKYWGGHGPLAPPLPPSLILLLKPRLMWDFNPYPRHFMYILSKMIVTDVHLN